MKKFIRIALIALLLCFGAVAAYTGWPFVNVYKDGYALKKEISETETKINEADAQISAINEEIETLSKENSDLYTEYLNWQRQNRKLEEVLEQE